MFTLTHLPSPSFFQTSYFVCLSLSLSLSSRFNYSYQAQLQAPSPLGIMRPLDEAEMTQVLEKLHKFVGSNLKHILERQAHEGPDGKGGYVFRLHKQRCYYVSDALVRRATNVGRDKLFGLGTCLGKFTKSGKFRLTVTCLDLIAAHAKHKIWLKPSAEMSFLYGNHVLKSGLGRITDNTAQYQGVVIFSMSDVPLGFGVAAKSTQDCRKLDPNDIVALHQADLGEYLRMEDEL